VSTLDLGGGRRATYEVIGKGPPAQMLPGGPGFASGYMRATANLFADVLQSHLIDPHGSGGSTPPADPADYSPEGHARFYEEVRAALGLGQITVFGHSFGATTALTYAALYPEAVERCIAVAPFGVGTEQDEAEGGGAAAQMEAMVERHRSAPWYPEAKATWDSWTERVLTTEDPGEVERMMATVLPLYTAHPESPQVAVALEEFAKDLKTDLAAAKAWEDGLYQGIDLRPLLARVKAPTLVVAGELDLICGPAQARPISEAVPNAKLVLIPDCGHLPSAEAPDRYRDEVVAWLEAVG
jgi:pimeloyl-ACP methyl ester carboxylesterase